MSAVTSQAFLLPSAVAPATLPSQRTPYTASAQPQPPSASADASSTGLAVASVVAGV
eukprot:CAMPEP_0195061392 /NCGR_PEP_ID=MMETSP0448-20130528/8345_1 /TAXON_ID=66468 /ORGANISM="Heterocapsa triquestra, Strain CCMP 448" /LENGTH=56 /DNA_ID=CAMNT_0040091953 /DNA_START=56 /DNA_END=222 /DNA_ORIENTATION=+